MSQTEVPQYATRNKQYVTRKQLALVAITSLGGFLRLYQIGSKGLWLDETFSVWMGGQPVGEMLGWVVRIDQHPPLYYLLLHFWITVFGDGEATVRALSALFGTLTIPVIYLLGRRLAGEKVGLLAALILAVSPFHVRLAQEARMYTLLALNASLALYAMLGVSGCNVSGSGLGNRGTSNLRPGTYNLAWLGVTAQAGSVFGPHRRKTGGAGAKNRRCRIRKQSSTGSFRPVRLGPEQLRLGYVVFTVATLFTHNTAVFFPIAANIFMLGLLLIRRLSVALSPCPLVSLSPCLPSSLRNWLLAQLAVLGLWLPWFPAFIAQSAGVYREFWLPAPTWETVVGVVAVFVSDFLPLPFAGLCAVGVLYAGLALLGLAYFRRRPAHIAFLLVIFATPFVGEWLVSLRRPIFYDRTLIWASIPLYLLLAAGMRWLETRFFPLPGRVGRCFWGFRGRQATFCQSKTWFLIALILVLAVNGLSLHEYYAHFEKEQWDDAAEFVAERVEPDDLILFNATWAQIPFDYYFRRLYNRPVVEHGVPVELFDRGVLEPKMAAGDLPRLRALIQGRERVWLVYSHDWYTDPEGLIPLALEGELDLLDRWEFHGLQVWLYEK